MFIDGKRFSRILRLSDYRSDGVVLYVVACAINIPSLRDFKKLEFLVKQSRSYHRCIFRHWTRTRG